MSDDLRSYLGTAIHAAREAARIQRYHLDTVLDIGRKSSDKDLVTHVDRLCETRIREIVENRYPDHVVLGEEEGQPQGEARCRWIVDPLDGTLNYAHGFPFFCVSVALEIEGIVEIGVVLDGVRDELFTAVRGEGALLNGRPIRVSSETDPGDAMLATGFAYNDETIAANLEVFARMVPRVRAVRRPGAAALDLCYVACGRLDGFWELQLNPWDVAAGVLIIAEAGGSVSSGSGAPYRLGEPVVIASNGHLHGTLVTLIGVETLA